MIRLAKAIAGNSDQLTAQAFIYPSGNLSLSGLITAEGEDVFTKVRSGAATLEERFFEMSEGIPQRLDEVLGVIGEELKDLENVQSLFASWHENVLYLRSSGSHQAYLLRDEKLVALISHDVPAQLISGHIKEGDRLLLITSSLEQSLSESLDDSNLSNLAKVDIENFDEEVEEFWGGEELKELKSDEKSIIPKKLPVAAILIDYHSDLRKEAVDAILPPKSGSPPKLTIPTLKFDLNLLSKFSQNMLKRKKFLLIALGAMLLGGAIFGAFSYLNRNQIQRSQVIDKSIKDVRAKLDLAVSLKDQDQKQSVITLNEAKIQTQEIINNYPQNNEALKLKEEIEKLSPDILKIYTITDWPSFLDLNLIKEGFSAKRLSTSLGKLIILDESKKSLVSLDLKNKSNQILAGETQFGQGLYSSINGDFAFVYSPDKGVVKVDTKMQKSSVAIKPDPDWGKIVDIYGFGSNFYLLDIIKNQIWKYVPVASGYSDKQEYIKEGQNLDLVDAKRFHIDSSIWILKSGEEILKLTQGAKDNFSITNLDSPFSNITGFFISDKTESIYILDSGNFRLVAVSKNGDYQNQYQGEKFKTVSDLVVDEENKKIYLLEGNKIYQIDLK